MRTNLFHAAANLASGNIRFDTGVRLMEWVKTVKGLAPGDQVSPEEELEIWQHFESLNKELSPKVSFNNDGVGNNPERKRRWALFGIFEFIEFRSEDPRIKHIFQTSFGHMSFKWFCQVERNAHPFYYKWALDCSSNNRWGLDIFEIFESRPEVLAVFQENNPKKFTKYHNQFKSLIVQRVQEA